MRPISLFTTVCAFAVVAALVPTVVNAASDPSVGHPLTVQAVKPARSDLPTWHGAAPVTAAAACDPVDTTGPAATDIGVDPVKVAIGVHDVHSFLYAAFLSDPCGIEQASVSAQRTSGAAFMDFPLFFIETEPDGTELWGVQVDLDPTTDLTNDAAGTWHSHVLASDHSGNVSTTTGATFFLQRWAKLTNNASPEPVTKDATITIAGKLSRANWDDLQYHGYTNQPVTLQFRTPSGSYANVKTITSSSTSGSLKTTVKAVRDGCFRFVFAGTTTTQAVKGTGDCVDVR